METTNNNKTAVFIVIIITQLAIIGWLIYDKFDTTQDTKELITNLENNNTEKDSIQKELEALYVEYEDLKINNDTINAKLQKEQEKIKEILEKLKNTKASNYYQIDKLKKEITTLKTIMKSYIAQISELSEENQKLVAENEEIKSNYENVVTEKEELSQESDSLKTKVAIASELQALNLRFFALNRRAKETQRTNKIAKFQTSFVLNENKITKTGNKYLYIRITDPTGKVLRNGDSGFFNYENNSIAYSATKTISYDGTQQSINIYYNNVEELPPGVYTVFIFVGNKQIADKQITMK